MKKLVTSITLALSLIACNDSDQNSYKTPEQCGCMKQTKTVKTYLTQQGQPKETTYSEKWLVCEPDTNGLWVFDASNGLSGENPIYIELYFNVECTK